MKTNHSAPSSFLVFKFNSAKIKMITVLILFPLLLSSLTVLAFQPSPDFVRLLEQSRKIAEQMARQSLQHQPGVYTRLAGSSGVISGILMGSIAIGSLAAGPAGELWAASANQWRRELAPYQRPRGFYIDVDGTKILTPPLRVFHMVQYLRAYLGISENTPGFPQEILNLYKLLENYPKGIYGSPYLKRQYQSFCNYLVQKMSMNLSTAKGRQLKRQIIQDVLGQSPPSLTITYEQTQTIEQAPPRLPLIKKTKKVIIVSALDIATFVAYHQYYHRNMSREEFLRDYLFLINWAKGNDDNSPDPLSDPMQRHRLDQLKKQFIAFMEQHPRTVATKNATTAPSSPQQFGATAPGEDDVENENVALIQQIKASIRKNLAPHANEPFMALAPDLDLLFTPMSPQRHEELVKEVIAEIPAGQRSLYANDSVQRQFSRESLSFLVLPEAVLLEISHPFIALAIDRSRKVQKRPIGRYFGTLKSAADLLMGDKETTIRVAQRLYKMHAGIRGQFDRAIGIFPKGYHYHALEPHALHWVYLTLIKATADGYELGFGAQPTSIKDRLVLESHRFGKLMGIDPRLLPTSWTHLQAQMMFYQMAGFLKATPEARDIVQMLFSPPIPGTGTPLRFLRWLSYHRLPNAIRNDLGMRENKHFIPLLTPERFVWGLRKTYPRIPLAIRQNPLVSFHDIRQGGFPAWFKKLFKLK